MEAAVRVGGKPADALLGPPIPDEVAYLWGWFSELDLSRRFSEHGPDPIGYEAIAAWAHLTDRHPLPHEVEALVLLDLVTRGVLMESRKNG